MDAPSSLGYRTPSAALLEEAQASREPPYPGFAKGFLYSEWANTPELINVPFDIGADPAERCPADLDFDQWLGLIQSNVVDLDDYITITKNAHGAGPPSFAFITANEAYDEDNTCVYAHLQLRFVGRILAFGVDENEQIVDLCLQDLEHVDRALSQDSVQGDQEKDVGCYIVDFRTMSSQVLHSCEIMGFVFTMSSLASTLAYGSTSHATRAIALDFLASRIRTIMSRYLPSGSAPSFFSLMHTSRAAVVGSIPVLIVCWVVKFKADDLPADVNILVPHGAFDAWCEWFANHAAEDYPARHKLIRFDKSVKSFRAFLLPIGGGRMMPFTVSESRKENVLYPALHCELTSQMTLLTATRIIIIYPTLTLNLTSVVGWMERKPRFNNTFKWRAFSMHHTSASLHAQCGLACAFIWRRTKDRSVADIYWGGYDGTADRNESPLHDGCLRWRVGRTCDNAKCSKYLAGFRF
ncbi:hypothetical protein B0H11DRAFT_2228645 [Mycena galericulata]|nr:hypothetical protein B0H11DRAFT_2246359 [Mycena galericulata]KAJ7491848.1 hypothetical protein B0H11DRAFT_2228645 [Mycena galericulata]